MDLGCFSVSLAVKDLAASRTFYENLGFEVIDDHQDQNWVVLKNGTTIIGMFHGMFENNILTFNPADVRAIQAHLKSQGVPLDKEADGERGPAHLMLTDPDGNAIMLDQFE